MIAKQQYHDDNGIIMVPLSDSVLQIKECLLTMRKQECNYYEKKGNTHYNHNWMPSKAVIVLPDTTIIESGLRQKYIEWMYSVVDTLHLNRESVAIATYYLDTSVAKGIIQSRRDYQLCAMTALQLAIKLHESTALQFNTYRKLSQGLFTEQDLLQMEMKMLHTALQWHVHPPTAMSFIEQQLEYLSSFGIMATKSTSISLLQPFIRYLLLEITRFIVELSICSSKFQHYSPSVIAYASLLVAIEAIDDTLHMNHNTNPYHFHRQIITEQLVKMNEDTTPIIDYNSYEIMECFGELQKSLEEVICLQSLIHTIYCSQGGGTTTTTCKTACSTVKTSSPKTHPEEQNPIHNSSSPRDCISYC